MFPLDLDLRKLRYFSAVAERLHFGRAAAALHVTQPTLSRQIRQLEQELGVALFARTSRNVALTPAGEQLALEALRLLAVSQAAIANTRRAGTGDRTLTLGFMLGADIEPTLKAFSDIHPEVDVRLKRVRWWNQAQELLDASVDVAFVRLPLSPEGLTILPLYSEPLRVALPADHPLAAKASVELCEVAGERVLVYANAPPEWNAFWTVDPRPDGTQPKQGPVIQDMEEIIEYVRAGRGIIFLPTAITEAFPRQDIAYVPVTDISPGQIALGWADANRSTLVTALVQAAESTHTVEQPTPEPRETPASSAVKSP